MKWNVGPLQEPYPGLLDWVFSGETGLSPLTIAAHLTGSTPPRMQSEPYDPSDFRRCELLLRAVPSLRPRLDLMRDVSPWWAYLVDNWDLIVRTIEEETPGVFDTGRPQGSAPKAYALIKKGRGLR